MIALEVLVEADGWEVVPDLERLLARAAEAAALEGGCSADSAFAASVMLADDASVQALNRDFRGQDKPTNVLSFPSDAPVAPGEPRHLGDIALALETVRREAADEDKSVADHAAHLVVHGVLHLLGQDHGDDADADAMEAAETRALATLGIPDPYQGTSPH